MIVSGIGVDDMIGEISGLGVLDTKVFNVGGAEFETKSDGGAAGTDGAYDDGMIGRGDEATNEPRGPGVEDKYDGPAPGVEINDENPGAGEEPMKEGRGAGVDTNDGNLGAGVDDTNEGRRRAGVDATIGE